MAKKAIITEYNLSFPNIERPFTIAQVSDLHERNGDEIAELLGKIKPDLIAVTGDTLERYSKELSKARPRARRTLFFRVLINIGYYLNWFFVLVFGRNNRRDIEGTYRFIKAAPKIAPTVMSLGNHEGKLTDEDMEVIQNSGAVLLDNADTELSVCGNRLNIGGLSTLPDEGWLKKFAQKNGFKLLMCHHPEYYDNMVAPLDIELTLAGHNHGGQIRVFGRGLICSGSGLFPKYDRGLFNGNLIVSAGCSNTVAAPRINNPRELVLIHLTPE